MTFDEALAILRAGTAIRCVDWPPGAGLILLRIYGERVVGIVSENPSDSTLRFDPSTVVLGEWELAEGFDDLSPQQLRDLAYDLYHGGGG